MNSITSAALAALIVLGTPSARAEGAPQATFVEYYAGLPFRESPFAELRGIHRMTAESARERNHFRFELDDRGRPIRISFRLGDRVRDLNDTANFFFTTPQMILTYPEGQAVRTFLDRHGNPMARHDGVYRERFHLDHAGWPRGLTFENADGNRVENGWGVAEYTWSITDDGTVVEHRRSLAGEPVPMRPNLPFHELHLHYGPSGYLALMQNVGPDGRLVNNELKAAQDKLEYQADGDMGAWNVLDANGNRVRGNSPDVARGIIEHDRWGYEVSTRYEDASGQPIRSAYGWGMGRLEHDRHGNLLERWTSEADGRPGINPRLGYAGYRMTWDKSGMNRLKLAYFDVDGAPTRHALRGFHEARSEYDRQGNRIRVSFLDVDGELVDRLDTGVATIAYGYDDRYRRVETRLFDRRGQPVNHRQEGWSVERLQYADSGEVSERRRLDDRLEPLPEEG